MDFVLKNEKNKHELLLKGEIMKNNQYDKIFEKKCDVCGKTLLASKTGNGECQYCGWYNNRLGETNENEVIFPNLISLNKARRLYQEGKPFLPDLDDFIGGLDFYGEMEFTYQGINYGVTRVQNDAVDLWIFNGGTVELFKDSEEFRDKAQINGKLLKDIWQEIENANWLQ